MKISIKEFFSKCDQIRSFLRIWSHLLRKSLWKTWFFVQWSVWDTSRLLDDTSFTITSPSRLEPGQREKINLNFYFHTSLRYLKRIYKCLFNLVQHSDMNGAERPKVKHSIACKIPLIIFLAQGFKYFFVHLKEILLESL